MILAKPTSTIRNYIFISLIALLLQGCFLFGGGGGSGESATNEGQVAKALGRENLDFVAERFEPLSRRRQRPHNAVDLREPGICDQQ